MLQSYTYSDTHKTYTKMNLSTVKWAQWDKTQSRDLLGLFICVCSSLCTVVAHNIARNRPDNFPCCPPDNHHCSFQWIKIIACGVWCIQRRATWWTLYCTYSATRPPWSTVLRCLSTEDFLSANDVMKRVRNKILPKQNSFGVKELYFS